MSNAITSTNAKSVTLPGGTVNPKLGSVATIARGSRYYLSAKGSRFRVTYGQDQTLIPSNEVQVVILGSSPYNQRKYFEGEYEPGKAKAPDCFSSDGIAPHPEAPNPQSDACSNCPMGQKNSKVVGGRGITACKYSKVISLMFVDDDEGEVRVVQADVQASSVFGTSEPDQRAKHIYTWREFAEQVATRGHNTFDFIVEMSFDENSSVPRFMFKPVGWVVQDDHLLEKTQNALQMDEAVDIIECKPPKQQ